MEQPTLPVGRPPGPSLVAASRQAHNLKVAGSNPAPATNANLSAAPRRAWVCVAPAKAGAQAQLHQPDHRQAPASAVFLCLARAPIRPGPFNCLQATRSGPALRLGDANTLRGASCYRVLRRLRFVPEHASFPASNRGGFYMTDGPTNPLPGAPASLVDRVKNILVSPKTEWPRIDAEPATVASIFTTMR